MRIRARQRLRFGTTVLVAAALAALFLVHLGRTSDEARAAGASALRKLAAGRVREARGMAAAALASDPDEPGARFVRACLRASEGDREGAFADVVACARRDRLDFAPCLDAAMIARSLARDGAVVWDETARTWFEEARDRAHVAAVNDPRAAVAEAAACVALERLEEAERRLDSLGPLRGALADDVDALRAAMLVARGDVAGARALLTTSVAERGSASLAAMLAQIRESAEALLRAGAEAARSGELGVARSFLRRAAWLAPDDLTPVTLLAATVVETGAAAVVDDETRRLAGVGPPGAAGALLVAEVLLLRGDAEGSASFFRQAMERAPGDPAAFRGAVTAALARGDARAAETLCRVRLEKGDGSGLAHFLLGATLEQLDDDAGAGEAYRAALAEDATNWTASDRLAQLCLRRGDVQGAAEVCDAALAGAPSCVPLLVRRAAAWTAAGEAGRAVALLVPATRERPGCAPLHLQWARTLLAAGDRCGAAARFETCLEADPRCVEAHLGAIGLAAAEGRLAAHVAVLRTRAAARPDDAALRFALGVAAQTSGDLLAAEREYLGALSLAPGLAVAANNLAWLLAVELGRPSEARRYAETAGRLLPRNPHVLDTRGWVRFLTGDLQRAVDDLTLAARLLPESRDVEERRVRAAAALESTSPAVPATCPVPEPETEVPR